MAAAPTDPLVSVDEYLNTSYEYDMEYVDGALVERATPTPAHGLTQLILAERLRRHRFEFDYEVISECRVELVPGSRYRIPDLLLCALPAPSGKVMTTVPLAVFEILSPDDRLAQQVLRFTEYWQLGVRQIVVLDPENFSAARYEARSLVMGDIDAIALPDGRSVPLSTAELFEELRQSLSRGR